MAEKAGEFDLIKRCFAPLAAKDAPAFGLTDDAAVLAPPLGQSLVFTKDAMVAGVHFLPDDPPDLIARKLLRVNLSDLAAMGAKAVGYLLAIALPNDIEADWADGFAQGLAQDQEQYECALLGGDTVSTPGPLTLSLTAVGCVPEGQALRRNGARVGDRIYVSGTLGDGALGLLCRQEKLTGLSSEHTLFLIRRYQVPEPRLALGKVLFDHAHAAMDISDGIAGDLAHITDNADVGATIRLAQLPLSLAARAAVLADHGLLPHVWHGGDDYELLFTAPKLTQETLNYLQNAGGVVISEIGEITADNYVTFLDTTGKAVDLDGGYRHF